MLVGLVSDTHDNRERTRRAVDLLEERGADALLHAGDVTSPDVIEGLLDGWRAWVAVGNMDRNPDGLVAAGERCSPTIPVDATHDVTVGSARIGLVHGHDRGRLDGMVDAGAFDLVVHGHTHEFRDETVGSTRIVNPGAVHRASTPSVCVYDTDEGVLERLPIGGTR
jgi:putative phosphoesterase